MRIRRVVYWALFVPFTIIFILAVIAHEISEKIGESYDDFYDWSIQHREKAEEIRGQS